MSYDLFFRSREQGKTISMDDFTSFFQSRRNYELSENEALYSNEATGVYFSFNYEEFTEPCEEPEENLLPFSFNINFYRPHIFALEAELELSAFVRHFDLLVSDPQNGGMGDGEYSREGFLKGWNCGNEFAYRSILQGDNPPKQVYTLPTEKIEAYWRWNYSCDDFQNALGESIFVPKIIMLDYMNQIRSAVVWGDGIPIAIPVVDICVIPRSELCPRKFFVRKEDMVVVDWAMLENILSNYKMDERYLPYYILDYVEPPESITKFIKRQKPFADNLQGVAFDQVLNRELVDKYWKKKDS